MSETLRGLTAQQVIDSRNKYGMNLMPRPKLRSAWDFFVEVFKDKLNIVLLVMMLMFVGLGVAGYASIYEALGIGIVLLVVAITTVATKLKSQRSAEELYQKSSLLYTNVIRDGRVVHIDSAQIVVGDIVVLRAGERICADGYIVDGTVDVNNAILNGESAEVKKIPACDGEYNADAPVNADSYTDSHSVFAGTTVISGEAHMRVVRIGGNTENAKIMATLYSISDVKTTLQMQLDKLADMISKIGSVCALVIFCVLMFVHLGDSGFRLDASLIYVVFSSLTVALTIFVAAVPEGLPFIIGIITSQNVNRMIRSNVLAKNPHKIPEAGNIQLLCTDKTGTLTCGFLQPVHNFDAWGEDIGFDDVRGGVVKDIFLTNVALNTDCVYDDNGEVVGGNSTGRALFGAVKDLSAKITECQKTIRVVDTILFDSANKFAAVKTQEKQNNCYYLGAPEIILANAKYCMRQDGQIEKINKEYIDNLIQQNAKQAMRLVAMAVSNSWATDKHVPEDLIFVSLVAMRDQVRPGVRDVVHTMDKSGVQVMMITGDILDTAHAIAIDCGIVSGKGDLAITAADLDALSDDRAKELLPKIKVIARATPATKLRVVQLAQSIGLCIGMCGDGTNDAPALKRADVGFAMGDGTDVSKEAGDIIITDNNFISIVNCILLGRTFVYNVRSFLRFQLPINFSLVVLSILFPLLFGLDAFTAVQILLVNIVMDSLNSLAFGGEPPHKEYLSEPAQGKNAALLSKSMLGQVIWTTFGFCCVFAMMELLNGRGVFASNDVYMSARFALLVVMAIVNGFCVRVGGFNIFCGLMQNPMFILVAIGVVGATVLAVSFGGSVLQLVPLNLSQWMIVLGLACAIIPINFAYRLMERKKR